jgi:O-methyltransferase
MDNFFLTEYFDWRIRRISLLDRLVSRVLSKMIGKTEFRSADFFDKLYANITGNATLTSSSGVMTNIEQRMNMYHLVSQVLAYGVEGDFVELGCNTGASSVLITKLLAEHNSNKKLAVYDSFEGLPKSRPIDGYSMKKDIAGQVRMSLRKILISTSCLSRKFTKDGFRRRCQRASQSGLLSLILMEIFMTRLG